MKKSLLISCGLLAILSIGSACTSDHPAFAPADVASPSTDKPIRFGASAETTRADITTNSLKSFNVYAYTGKATSPQVFMDNVTVTKNATNVWTYSPVQYWPANELVDFYAFAPAEWTGGVSPISPVPYDNILGIQDIIYAVSSDMNANNQLPHAQVLFNFRHALSKVVVKLSSTNPNLKVKVSNVAMAYISTRGNFHFPGESTSGTATPENTGYWTDHNTPGIYLYLLSQRGDEVVTLTSTPNDLSASDPRLGGPKYLLPQPLVWNNNGSGADTYLTVMCSVYDATTDTKLWPNANTPTENVVEGSSFGDGLIKFPLSTTAFNEWKPGYSYVYNVVINSNEEMGAIEFGDPTVETFVEVETNYH